MTLRRAGIVLAIIGALVAAYLTVMHYTTAVPLVCSQNGLIDCARVITSPQSVWLGLPVAGVGLVWCLVMLALWVKSGPGQPGWLNPVRMGWAALGGVTVVYLVYVELVEIGHLCIWCTALHVVILTLLVLSILAWPPSAATDAPSSPS